MKRAFKFFTGVLAGLVAFGNSGCASRRQASNTPAFVPPPPPRLVAQPPPGALIVPPRGGPPQVVPPGGFPTAPPSPPPSSFPTPPPGPPSGFPTAPSVPPATSGIPPGEALDRVGWRGVPGVPPPPPVAPLAPAAPPTVLLLPPVPERGSDVPGPVSPNPAVPKQEPSKQYYPPQTNEPPASSLPVGIYGFDKARDHVATGQRPTLEGLDWLQKSGYKVVVFLHVPGERIDTDRLQVEKRGMTFLPIEINARELNRDSVDRFIRVQSGSEKVFVYDLDGSISGAMWYLSFRMIDMDHDEIARIKAASLGMGESREAARDLWQSVRKVAESK